MQPIQTTAEKKKKKHPTTPSNFLMAGILIKYWDPLIYSSNTITHVRAMDRYLKALRDAGLKIRPERCLLVHRALHHGGGSHDGLPRMHLPTRKAHASDSWGVAAVAKWNGVLLTLPGAVPPHRAPVTLVHQGCGALSSCLHHG